MYSWDNIVQGTVVSTGCDLSLAFSLQMGALKWSLLTDWLRLPFPVKPHGAQSCCVGVMPFSPVSFCSTWGTTAPRKRREEWEPGTERAGRVCARWNQFLSEKGTHKCYLCLGGVCMHSLLGKHLLTWIWSRGWQWGSHYHHDHLLGSSALKLRSQHSYWLR